MADETKARGRPPRADRYGPLLWISEYNYRDSATLNTLNDHKEDNGNMPPERLQQISSITTAIRAAQIITIIRLRGLERNPLSLTCFRISI